MKEAAADEIRNEMDTYLNGARTAYIQMLKVHLATSDHVIDGANEFENIIDEVIEIISRL